MNRFAFGIIAVIALGVIGIGALTASPTHAQSSAPGRLLDVTAGGINCVGEPVIPNRPDVGDAILIPAGKGFDLEVNVFSGAPSARLVVEVFEAVDSKRCGGHSSGLLKTDKLGNGTVNLSVFVPSLGDGQGTELVVIRLRPKFTQRGEIVTTYVAILAPFEAQQDTEPPVLTLPDDL